MTANQLKLIYDEFSRLVEETDPLGRTIRYRHHQHTSLVKQIDYPDGSTWKATYNDKGTLLEEYDALGQRTEYFHGEDGLPHTIVDANHKSKYLWWNSLAQVLKF